MEVKTEGRTSDTNGVHVALLGLGRGLANVSNGVIANKDFAERLEETYIPALSNLATITK